jgi:hypothetical protein
MDIKDSSLISRRPGLLAGRVDDEVVMMDSNDGKYYGLDPVGSMIWDILEKPVYFSSIIDILEEAYDVRREQCQSDVLEFLRNLYNMKLVVIENNE